MVYFSLVEHLQASEEVSEAKVHKRGDEEILVHSILLEYGRLVSEA